MSTVDLPEQPAPAGSLASETLRYYAIHALGVAGGFVSMPITTRLLSQEQYGQLSLILSFIGLVAVGGKLGFATSTTRFFPQHRLGGDSSLRAFCETMVTGSFASGVAGTALAILLALSLLDWRPADSVAGLVLVGAVVVVRVVTGPVLEVLRSMRAVHAIGALQLGSRWATIAVAAAWMWFDPRAMAVVAATVLVEGAALLAGFVQLHRRRLIRRPRLVGILIREANVYGVPLALASVAGVVTLYVDRFLIEHYLGLEFVAQYAVPYDLTREVAKALFLPVQMALLPPIFQRWTERREDEVKRSMSDLITHLLAVAIPLGAVFVALGPEIVTLMASARYENSARLMAYLLPGVFLNEGAFLLGIGLRLSRRTGMVALISLGGAVVNVALNVFALPRFGLEGAAVATSVTYLVLTVALYRGSAPVLPLRLRYSLVVKSVVVSSAAVAAIRAAGAVSTSLPVDIVLRSLGGAVFCAVGILAADARARSVVRRLASDLAGAMR